MKKLDNKTKNTFYFFYRIIEPVFDPIKFINGVIGYLWFIKDFIKYRLLSKEKIRLCNLFPQLHDKKIVTPFDAHYFFQQLWVFEEVLKNKPQSHTDVASSYELSGYLSKIVPTKFIDYRPIETNLKNLEIIRGDITKLPVDDSKVESLSCLHVVEHIGLGRYGDSLDPEGFEKATAELSRVLSQHGNLYFSTPIGKENLYFNAHRVFNPKKIINLFNELELVSFNVVDDDGKFVENTKPEKYDNLNYGCGMFHFRKIREK